MRRIERTHAFKRDFRRCSATPKHRDLEPKLRELLALLAVDKPLPEHYRDHPLSGNCVDHRDCHVKPDLVLIYSRPDPHTLLLARSGSHSELFKR